VDSVEKKLIIKIKRTLLEAVFNSELCHLKDNKQVSYETVIHIHIRYDRKLYNFE